MNARGWIYRKIRDNIRRREAVRKSGYRGRRLSYFDYVQAYRELHRLLDQAWLSKEQELIA